ncbi:MAG: hypothetical protein K8R23_15735 [Chthoniobacter sp.]|nr:hypothetical protein [Chthoniobacter sp.]
MQLDLLKDSRKVREHLKQRAREYRAAHHRGPGKGNDPITQITIGYQFDQAGWVAVVFDTRPEAKPDGEWNFYIKQNATEFPDWWKAYADWREGDSPLALTLADGTMKSLGPSAGDQEVAACFGVMLQEALTGARKDGDLDTLSLAKDCILVIEEQDGRYGWSNQPDDGSDAYLKQLADGVSSKGDDGQIAHWIQVLDRVASGEESQSDWSFLAPRHAIEHLTSFGERAVIPLLQLVRKWSGEAEFQGDQPQRMIEINEMPMQTPIFVALRAVCDSGSHNPETESLLQEILRKSMQANASRRLWGIIPVWTARCLHRLFQYPEPGQDDETNRLLNPEDFIDRRR